MDQDSDRQRRRAEQRDADIRKLRSLEQDAVRSGRKLGARDRLKAAFHLTRAWKQANAEGLRKEDFQEAVLERLQRPHQNRQEFRLNNWTLRRGEDPTTQDLLETYRESSTPQKAFEPYLVGVTVAADHCGEDPDDWKLALVRDLSIWSRQNAKADLASPDDRPAETLAILIHAMCSNLGERNRLADTFETIRRMGCRWEMFSERLVATEQGCMERIESPISPAYVDNIYFEEMFPFPSIPLLQVPYGVGKPEVFHVAPDALLRSLDQEHLANGKYLPLGFGGTGELFGKWHYNVPDDAPGLKAVSGEIFWIREIRLCIAPDGRRGFTAALESRPRIEVNFDEAHEFGGRHHVIGGYDLALQRALFYERAEDGGPFLPKIRSEDGKVWRVTIPCLPDGSFRVTDWSERNSDSTGWVFDTDPVGKPGLQLDDPFLLSYTPATAPYLRHWLTQDWSVVNLPGRAREFAESCPWVPTYDPDGIGFDSVWSRNVPPLNELNFPDRSNATWVECCLHNGLIEEALQAKIDLLQEQTWRLQSDWHAARERHSNALLRRWKTDADTENT